MSKLPWKEIPPTLSQSSERYSLGPILSTKCTVPESEQEKGIHARFYRLPWNLLLAYNVAEITSTWDDALLLYQTRTTASGEPPRSSKFAVLPQKPCSFVAPCATQSTQDSSLCLLQVSVLFQTACLLIAVSVCRLICRSLAALTYVWIEVND